MSHTLSNIACIGKHTRSSSPLYVFMEYLRYRTSDQAEINCNRLAPLADTFYLANIFMKNLVFLWKSCGFLRRSTFST